MTKRIAAIMAAGLAAAVSGCGKPSEGASVPAAAASSPASKPPSAPSIEVSAEPATATAVKFVVSTNVPTPIQVMANIDLAGQKADDVYIGYGERITLTGPVTTFTIDGSKAREPLPGGDYEARVTFYPRWGAEGNEPARSAPEMTDMVKLRLVASGELRADAEGRNVKQVWLMENVIIGTPWNEGEFVAKLGKYRKAKSTLSQLHDAYYFPAADMTLIVNRLKNEVTTWREGEALS